LARTIEHAPARGLAILNQLPQHTIDGPGGLLIDDDLRQVRIEMT
jgi:hypothetical protein